MKKIKDILIGTMLFLVCLFAGVLAVKSSCERQAKYEVEHNCKFDYNDLCYTEEERPYLFN